MGGKYSHSGKKEKVSRQERIYGGREREKRSGDEWGKRGKLHIHKTHSKKMKQTRI